MFDPVSNKPDFAAAECRILDFWQQEKVFQQSLDQRANAPEFVFYDGPPFATGLPHYGHLLAGTIKDIVPRYQTMRGHRVERRFGWDCHGLPVEYEVEQDLGITGKSDIEAMGVDVFNEKCRSIVLRYTREWRTTVTRMGRWVDFDHEYKTMDPSYMESIWWVFKALWEKGLVYQGEKILPYCPRCATPLSNFETNQGYADVTDPAITVRFALTDESSAYVLAWTTTPWTLPSNMALAVGTDIIYAKVIEDDAVYYLAQDRLDAYYKDGGAGLRIETVAGRDLVGRTYEPLFPYFADRQAEGAFRILAGDFVSTEEGTGIVHIAPGFGEDDNRLGKANGLPALCPIDTECRFTSAIPDYEGRLVKEADADIMRRLKDEGSLVHRSSILHPYPHCWRCDAPLIYRAVATWFVNVEVIKDRLVAANQTVNWVPAHLRDGRFGKWLEGARDWAISRNRYWGTPLPIWRSADGEETVCIGSIEELETLSGQRINDLHKHFADAVEIPSQEGRGPLKRIPEVLDCWFESGAMPYAQSHYPFENKEHFENHFPPDFIAEGLDQTRGWFYTLMVLAVALFDKPAFKNVVVNGLILAEDGKKMSKRLKNYPDPAAMINAYGADAVRLYMIYSPVVRAESLRFSEKGIQSLLRHIFIPLWNAYSFFVTYANIDHWSPPSDADSVFEPGPNVLDRWILSSLETLVADVTSAMDQYDLQRAVRPFIQFVEDLTNWYIRRSRRRFWKSQDDQDKRQAYRTLHHVLLQTAKVAAPFIPFLSETLYRNLRTESMPCSVHLCDFPSASQQARHPDLERDMANVMTVVRMGRQLRADHNLKVRQPLAAMRVVSRDAEVVQGIAELQELVLEELNVKAVHFSDQDLSLAHLKAKADFRRLGPRFGPRTAQVAKALAALPSATVAQLLSDGTLDLDVDGDAVALVADDAIVERIPIDGLVVASEGALVIALETDLTPDLSDEGLAREFVNKVQTMRKNANLDVTQRINMAYAGPAEVKRAVDTHTDTILTETLGLACEFRNTPNADMDTKAETWDLNGHTCMITIDSVERDA